MEKYSRYSFLPQHLDSLVQHYQLVCDGVVIDWLLGNYFDALIEERFHQVRERWRDGRGARGNGLEVHSRRRV